MIHVFAAYDIRGMYALIVLKLWTSFLMLGTLSDMGVNPYEFIVMPCSTNTGVSNGPDFIIAEVCASVNAYTSYWSNHSEGPSVVL